MSQDESYQPLSLIVRFRRQVYVAMLLFVPLAALVAVTFHDWHVHYGHAEPIEERIERIECWLGFKPGKDSSSVFPFLPPKENAICHYPSSTTSTTRY